MNFAKYFAIAMLVGMYSFEEPDQEAWCAANHEKLYAVLVEMFCQDSSEIRNDRNVRAFFH